MKPLQVISPFPQFFDSDGTALDNGFVYIGEVNENPETDPILIYSDYDRTIPVAQPVRTLNGYPTANGSSPINIYYDEEYSITVRDKDSELIYTNPAGYGLIPEMNPATVFDDRYHQANAQALRDAGVPNAETRMKTCRVYSKDGGVFRWVTSSIYSDAGEAYCGNFISDGSATSGWERIFSGATDIRWFGAVGGDEVLDTAAIIAANVQSKHLFVPTVPGAFIFANVTPLRGSIIEGESSSYIGAGISFKGNAASPCFLCGNGDVLKREITFKNLAANGSGFEVIKGDGSPNMKIYNCHFTTDSATKNVIDLRLCVRSTIEETRLAATGGGWAFRGMEYMNGLKFSHNIITGTALGGALILGKTQGANIDNNVIESSLKGFYIGSTSHIDDGQCSSINMRGNYFEQCRDPLHIGLVRRVVGGQFNGNFISNSLNEIIPERDSTFKIGRIQNYEIKRNTIYPHSTENVFELYLNDVSADLMENEISGNRLYVDPLTVYKLTGTYATNTSIKRTVGGANYFDFTESQVASREYKEYLTPRINANESFTAAAFLHNSELVLGGKLLSADIVEARGDLGGGSVYVGTVANNLESVSQNLSGLSFDAGYLSLTLLASNIKTTSPNIVRTIRDDAATGSYRVRLRYRAI